MKKFLVTTLFSFTLINFITSTHCHASVNIDIDDLNRSSSIPLPSYDESNNQQLRLTIEAKGSQFENFENFYQFALNTASNNTKGEASPLKQIDTEFYHFIQKVDQLTLENYNFMSNQLYTNNDNRLIPHPNQAKKSNETLWVGKLREPSYINDSNYNASGKTYRQVSQDGQRGITKNGHFNLSFGRQNTLFNWPSINDLDIYTLINKQK